MSGEDRQKTQFAVLALVVALLLLAANVQLWRLAERDQDGGGGTASAQKTQSSLPPPTTGTSNEVLSKRLRQVAGRVTTPLQGLTSQLTSLQALGPLQSDMVEQLSGVNSSIRRFGGVRGEIGQMTSGMREMVSSTGQMSNGLNALGTDMSGMLAVMRRVEGGIGATNASTQRASKGIDAMRRSTDAMVAGIGATSASTQEASMGIAAMREDTDAMAKSIAETAAAGKEMNAALVEMNQTMSNLLEFFCLALGSTTGPCAGVEAEPPPAPVEATSAGSLEEAPIPGLEQAQPKPLP